MASFLNVCLSAPAGGAAPAVDTRVPVFSAAASAAASAVIATAHEAPPIAGVCSCRVSERDRGHDRARVCVCVCTEFTPRVRTPPRAGMFAEPCVLNDMYFRAIEHPSRAALYDIHGDVLRIPLASPIVCEQIDWNATSPLPRMLSFDARDWRNARRDVLGLAEIQAPIGFVRVPTDAQTYATNENGGVSAGACGFPEGGAVFDLLGLGMLRTPPTPTIPVDGNAATGERTWSCADVALHEGHSVRTHSCVKSGRVRRDRAGEVACSRIPISSDCVTRDIAYAYVKSKCIKFWLDVRQARFYDRHTDSYVVAFHPHSVSIAIEDVYAFLAVSLGFALRVPGVVPAAAAAASAAATQDAAQECADGRARKRGVAISFAPDAQNTPYRAIEKAMRCTRRGRDGALVVDPVALDIAAAQHLNIRSFVAFVAERLYMCSWDTASPGHPMHKVLVGRAWIDPAFPRGPLAPGRAYQTSGRFEAPGKWRGAAKSSFTFFAQLGWMLCGVLREIQRLQHDLSTKPQTRGGCDLCGIFQLRGAYVMRDKEAYMYAHHSYERTTRPLLSFGRVAAAGVGGVLMPAAPSSDPPTFTSLPVAANTIQSRMRLFYVATKNIAGTDDSETPAGMAQRQARAVAPGSKQRRSATAAVRRADQTLERERRGATPARRRRHEKPILYMEDDGSMIEVEDDDAKGGGGGENGAADVRDASVDAYAIPPFDEDAEDDAEDDADYAEAIGSTAAAAAGGAAAGNGAGDPAKRSRLAEDEQVQRASRIAAAELAASATRARLKALAARVEAMSAPRRMPRWDALVFMRMVFKRVGQGTEWVIPSALMYPRNPNDTVADTLHFSAHHPLSQSPTQLCHAWLNAGAFRRAPAPSAAPSATSIDDLQLDGALSCDYPTAYARDVPLPDQYARAHMILWDAVAAERARTDASLGASANFLGGAADASAVAWVFQTGLRAGLPLSTVWFLVCWYTWLDRVNPMWLQMAAVGVDVVESRASVRPVGATGVATGSAPTGFGARLWDLGDRKASAPAAAAAAAAGEAYVVADDVTPRRGRGLFRARHGVVPQTAEELKAAAIAAAAAVNGGGGGDDDDASGGGGCGGTDDVAIAAPTAFCTTLPHSQRTRDDGFFPAGLGRVVPSFATGPGPWPSVVAALLRCVGDEWDAGFLSAARPQQAHAPPRTLSALNYFLGTVIGEGDTLDTMAAFAAPMMTATAFPIHASRQYGPEMLALARATTERFVPRVGVVNHVLNTHGARLLYRGDLVRTALDAAANISLDECADQHRCAIADVAIAASNHIANFSALIAAFLVQCGQDDPLTFPPDRVLEFAARAATAAPRVRCTPTYAVSAAIVEATNVVPQSATPHEAACAVAIAAARAADTAALRALRRSLTAALANAASDPVQPAPAPVPVPAADEDAAFMRARRLAQLGDYTVHVRGAGANGAGVTMPLAEVAHWFAAGVVEPIVRLLLTAAFPPGAAAPPDPTDSAHATHVRAASDGAPVQTQRLWWGPEAFETMGRATLRHAGLDLVRLVERILGRLDVDPKRDPEGAARLLREVLAGDDPYAHIAVVAAALAPLPAHRPAALTLPDATPIGTVARVADMATATGSRTAPVPSTFNRGAAAATQALRNSWAPVFAVAIQSITAGAATTGAASAHPAVAATSVMGTTPRRLTHAAHQTTALAAIPSEDRTDDLRIENDHDAISWMHWAALQHAFATAPLSPRLRALRALMSALGYTQHAVLDPDVSVVRCALAECAAAFGDDDGCAITSVPVWPRLVANAGRTTAASLAAAGGRLAPLTGAIADPRSTDVNRILGAMPAVADALAFDTNQEGVWRRHFDAAARICGVLVSVFDAGISMAARSALVTAVCDRAMATSYVPSDLVAASAPDAQARPRARLRYPRRDDGLDRRALTLGLLMFVEERLLNVGGPHGGGFVVEYVGNDGAWMRQARPERVAPAGATESAPADVRACVDAITELRGVVDSVFAATRDARAPDASSAAAAASELGARAFGTEYAFADAVSALAVLGTNASTDSGDYWAAAAAGANAIDLDGDAF